MDARIIRSLKEYGYIVFSISDETPGISDSNVIEIAVKKNGYIITEDKDFGDELVYNNQKSHQIGSLLLRIFDLPIDSKIQLVIETLSVHNKNLKESFSVLTSKKLRIRKYRL